MKIYMMIVLLVVVFVFIIRVVGDWHENRYEYCLINCGPHITIENFLCEDWEAIVQVKNHRRMFLDITKTSVTKGTEILTRSEYTWSKNNVPPSEIAEFVASCDGVCEYEFIFPGCESCEDFKVSKVVTVDCEK